MKVKLVIRNCPGIGMVRTWSSLKITSEGHIMPHGAPEWGMIDTLNVFVEPFYGDFVLVLTGCGIQDWCLHLYIL